MSTPPTNEFAFHEGDPLVLTVYFLAFGFWTAAAGNDFISSTWRSVRETRQRGKVHVVFVFIPMIYICVYVHFQHKNEDYKEMGAALLALLFALLHLAQTFVGLWQLHMFKLWTISAIKSMESLGYKTSLQEKANIGSDESLIDDDDYDVFSSFWKQASLIIFPQERDRIKKLADDILVNETLVDNRLSDVQTVCKFRLFSRKENIKMKEAESTFCRLCLWFGYGSANAVRGIIMLFSLAFLKSPCIPSANSAPRLIPRKPESIWLNWATTLVAQAGWTLDKFARTHPDRYAEKNKAQNHLAAQVLLSAALHTQRMGATTASSNVSDSSTECLGFLDWQKYPKLCRLLYSKQEFLERACKTGSGLPYQAVQSKAVQEKGGVQQYGYSNFESELRRAREALPPEIETNVKNFDVEQLEWFTIIVSEENWRLTCLSHEIITSESRTEVQEAVHERSTRSSESLTGIQEAVHERSIHERSIPIQNLKAQIEFEKLSDFSLEDSKLPFLGHVLDANLWGNRNVLEASCHIDNWISLSTGEKKASEILQNLCPFEGEECKRRLTATGEHIFVDRSVTFLGCSMEMLRSSLAKWAFHNEAGHENSWNPPIFPTHLVTFPASVDFMTCLRSLRSVLHMSKLFVKMRVLWELQNQFHTSLPREGVAPSCGEAMALCILSFPTVSVDPVRVRRREQFVVDFSAVDLRLGNEEQFQIDDYEYVIRAPLGPQDLQLCVSFHVREYNSEIAISTRICAAKAGEESRFFWEAWRNAFIQRLKGRGHFNAPSFIPPLYDISSGMKKIYGSATAVIPQEGAVADMIVWKGWLPHCTSTCMFELATHGFIRQPEAYEHLSLPYSINDRMTLEYSIPRETLVPVEYERANAVWFKNASLVADDLLQSAYGSMGERDAQSALDRAEMLLSYGSRKCALARAEMLLSRNSNVDADLALRLLQVTAVHGRNFTALEKAIEILLRNGRELEAVKLLEKFYAHGNDNGGVNQDNLGQVRYFLRNENYVNQVTLLFKEILKAMKLDIYRAGVESDMQRDIYVEVVDKYQMFLLLSILYGGIVVPTVELLNESIDESKVGNATICFTFLLAKELGGVQRDLPRAVRLSKRGIRQGDAHAIFAMWNLAGILPSGAYDDQDLRLAMQRFDKLIDECEDIHAMIRLADLLVEDGDSFPDNLPRAAKLYIRAVVEDESGGVEALEKLAGVLRIGGNEVQRTVSEYTSAKEEDGCARAMNAIATILRTGGDGVLGDPERTAAISLDSAA